MFALILAGGRGERLRPLTDRLPKPMVSVAGRPLLERQLEWLRAGGVTEAVFLVGYRAEAILEHFGDGAAHGVRAHYVREELPLGRGGALRLAFDALPALRDEPRVVAVNGDVLTAAPLADLVADYDARLREDPGHLATILTVPMTSPYGIVETDAGGRVLAFREKAQLPHRINGGVYVLHPDVRHKLPEAGDHETTTFPELAASGGLSAVHSDAWWRSVDSMKDRAEAEARLGT